MFFVIRPRRENFSELCAIFHVDVLRDRADGTNACTYPSREIKFMSNSKTDKTNYESPFSSITRQHKGPWTTQATSFLQKWRKLKAQTFNYSQNTQLENWPSVHVLMVPGGNPRIHREHTERPDPLTVLWWGNSAKHHAVKIPGWDEFCVYAF